MTDYTTVRIRTETRDLLRDLATDSGQSMAALLEEAVERLRRERFLREVAADYAALRDDPASSKALDDEIHAWDATLADGLPAEPPAKDGLEDAPLEPGAPDAT